MFENYLFREVTASLFLCLVSCIDSLQHPLNILHRTNLYNFPCELDVTANCGLRVGVFIHYQVRKFKFQFLGNLLYLANINKTVAYVVNSIVRSYATLFILTHHSSVPIVIELVAEAGGEAGTANSRLHSLPIEASGGTSTRHHILLNHYRAHIISTAL